MTTRDTGETVRSVFAAFEAKDRKTMEALLSDDFRFSSPQDERLTKAQYFERCWPNSDKIRNFKIEKIFVRGDEAFVRYVAERVSDGGKFRNTEYFRLIDQHVVEIDVYFGRDLPKPVVR